MKRYLLFSGGHPQGGFEDYKGSYDTIKEAKEEGKGSEWSHIVDSYEDAVVWFMEDRVWLKV